MSKRCIKCDNNKPLGLFYKRSKSCDGVENVCIMCRKTISHLYYLKNGKNIQAQKLKTMTDKYKNDSQYRENKKVSSRQRYYEKLNKKVPETIRHQAPANVYTKSELQQQRNERVKLRYANDPEWKEKKQKNAREYYYKTHTLKPKKTLEEHKNIIRERNRDYYLRKKAMLLKKELETLKITMLADGDLLNKIELSN